MTDLNKLIKEKVKEKKVSLGFDSAMKLLKSKKPEMVIYAKNLPEDRMKLLKHNAKASSVAIEEYSGTGMDLGLVCGKPFSVGVIAIKGSDK